MLSGDNEWSWAHLMWQVYKIPFEEWAKKEREVQLAYIASHLAEMKSPVNRHHAFINSFFKKN